MIAMYAKGGFVFLFVSGYPDVDESLDRVGTKKRAHPARLAKKHGTVVTTLDTRGNPVEMLAVRGYKNDDPGTFEYIKNTANEICHRFFNKD